MIEILVSEGDEVTEEQGLVTLESDKATMDVPSPVAGKVAAILGRALATRCRKARRLMEIEAGEDSGDEGDSDDHDAASGTEAAEADEPAEDKVPTPQAATPPRRQSPRNSSAAPKAATPWPGALTRRRGCSTPGPVSAGWRASWGSTSRR